MSPTFEPFQDRLSRDIRNGLSTSFIKAVALLDPEPFRQKAVKYLAQAPGDCYREYIEDRLSRYEDVLVRLGHGPDEMLWRAVVLWDRQLFFEVHELLEQGWKEAIGDEKMVLQAMIRAAGVYIKLEYGYRAPAMKMAARALPVLTKHRDTLTRFFPPDRLIRALSSPDYPPPTLLD